MAAKARATSRKRPVAKRKAAKPRPKPGRSAKALTERRHLFVERYLTNGHNAAEAAVFAGCGVRSARKQGWVMLHEPDVAARVARRAREAVASAEASTARWVEEVAALAFCDVTALFAAGGNMRDKLAALNVYGRHLGLFERDNKQRGKSLEELIAGAIEHNKAAGV